MTQSTIPVLLIDPSTLSRQGLASLLRRDRSISVVAEVGSTAEARSIVGSCAPQVIVADVPALTQRGRHENLQFFQNLPQVVLNCALLVLTSSSKEGDVFEALRLGAVGYMLKDCDVTEIIRTIKLSTSGRQVVLPNTTRLRLISMLEAQDMLEKEQVSFELLTKREIAVLELVGQGVTNRQIAGALYMSENTVKAHTRNIMSKLDLRSKAELVAWSARRTAANIAQETEDDGGDGTS